MPTVLVVDDEELFRTMVSDSLSQLEFRVLTAEDGERALEVLEEERVDAVVLDIVLPGMDGLEVLHRIKRKDSDLPVIMVTATEALQNAIFALREGAFDYFRKPLNLEELHHSLIQAIEKYHLTLKNKQRLRQLELFEQGSSELTTLMKKSAAEQLLHVQHFLLQKTVDLIADVLGVEIVSLMLIEKETQEMRVAFARGLPPEVVGKTSKKVGEGIAGWVAKEGKPLLIKDVSLHPFGQSEFYHQYTTRSLMSIPLRQNEKIIGVLNANNKTSGEDFSEEDLSLFKAFSHLISLALTNVHLYQKLVQSVQELAKTNRKLTRVNRELKKRVEELDAFRQEILGPS